MSRVRCGPRAQAGNDYRVKLLFDENLSSPWFFCLKTCSLLLSMCVIAVSVPRAMLKSGNLQRKTSWSSSRRTLIFKREAFFWALLQKSYGYARGTAAQPKLHRSSVPLPTSSLALTASSMKPASSSTSELPDPSAIEWARHIPWSWPTSPAIASWKCRGTIHRALF